jgi:hypothetical protein
MGKRKIHDTITYYTCDWTALPMSETNCYMPSWKVDAANSVSKLVKHGSYLNWECVVAHAIYLNKDVERVRAHIDALVGAVVEPAPPLSRFDWLGGKVDFVVGCIRSHTELHAECTRPTSSIMAVRILASDASVVEVLCNQEAVDAKFEPFLTRPYTIPEQCDGPQKLMPLKKSPSREHQLAVYYWPFKNGLPLNATASNLFKMQIYGDVLITKQTKEPSHLPRERFVNYSIADYFGQFTAPKRAKKVDQQAISAAAYTALKQEMQGDLNAVEHASSSLATKPGELAKASTLPVPSGRELADLVDPSGAQRETLRKMAKLESRMVAPHTPTVVETAA